MTIEHYVSGELGLYIPFYEGGGIHTELCNYLICRTFYRGRFNLSTHDKPLKSINMTTQRLLYYRVKLLLDYFELNEVHFTEATYEYHIESFKDFLRNNDERLWSEESLRLYVGTWRQFYEFLTLDGVMNTMHFPPKGETQRRVDGEDDFLNYTREDIYETVTTETAIDVKRLTFKDDYTEDVMSMPEYWALYNKLYEDDPVFAVMASTMLQTYLRIGGVLQFPRMATKRNPLWQRFHKMHANGKKWQKLNYIKKGGGAESLLVHIHTMDIIDSQYLEPFYQERKALFQATYAQQNHALKKGINVNSEFMWLNKHGSPVTSSMLQAAFRKASKALGFNVHPHMLRHTGATQTLWRYCYEKKIEVHEGMAGDIHAWLKDQLGHTMLSTTKMYIRTVSRLKASAVLESMLPGQMPELDTAISGEAINAYNKAMKDHEEYMLGRAEDEAEMQQTLMG
jgi:integrase